MNKGLFSVFGPQNSDVRFALSVCDDLNLTAFFLKQVISKALA